LTSFAEGENVKLPCQVMTKAHMAKFSWDRTKYW